MTLTSLYLRGFMDRNGFSYTDAAATLGVPQWQIWAVMLGILPVRQASALCWRVMEVEAAIRAIDYEEF